MSAAQSAKSLLGRMPPRVRLTVKCAVLFALVIWLCYWIVLEEKADHLTMEEYKEEHLRKTFLTKKSEAINLPAYRTQLADVELAFGRVIRSLPPTFEGAYEKAVRAATAHSLRVEHMSVSEHEPLRDFYAQLPASLKLAGTFHDLGAFLNDLAELDAYIMVDDFRLEATALPGIVSMDASLSAFRYLNEQEIAAARSEAARKKRAAKK